MTWLPICLFLALLANAKLESEFINRLPRDVEETTVAPSTASSTTPSTTASSTTPSTTASSTTPSTTASSTTPSTTESSTTSSSTASSTTPSTTASSTTSSTTASSTTSSTTEGRKKEGEECDAESLNNIVCENDMLQFCGPNNKIMFTPCVVNGRQGYCNCEKNGCVRQKPVCPNDKTKCYQPNTKLPDNLDCHKFTYCNQNNEKLTLQCPGKLIYDMTAEKCTDSKSARCHRVTCPRGKKDLQLIPFPQAKNYYVLCYGGIGDVRKCPDKYYGIRSNSCQFDCKLRNASGVFQDSNLEKCRDGHYYACKRSGSNYITSSLKCPLGMTLDEDLEICTEEDNCSEPESPEENL